MCQVAMQQSEPLARGLGNILSRTGVKERTTDFSLIMYICFLKNNNAAHA
jgi:hypothetical protein